MHQPSQPPGAKPATPRITRRRVMAAAGSASALWAVGCGGSGDGGAPETPPPPAPPVPRPSGIRVLAGHLGGEGDLQARGTAARLRGLGSIASGPDGSVWINRAPSMMQITSEGDLRNLPDLPDISAGGVAVSPVSGQVFAIGTGVGVIYRLSAGDAPAWMTFVGTFAPYPNGGFVDGVGTAAKLKLPRSPVFDVQGRLYFVDRDNRAVRLALPDGTVTTVAGQPSNTVMQDGAGAAAGFGQPRCMTRLPAGDFIIADGTRLRRMTPQGAVSTLPGEWPGAALDALLPLDEQTLLAISGHGVVRIALATGQTTTVLGSTTEGGFADGAGEAARFQSPTGLARLPGGDWLVADSDNRVLRRVDAGTFQTANWVGLPSHAGLADGTGEAARFQALQGQMATDAAGNLYAIERAARLLRQITPDGVASTVLTNFPADGGLALDAQGRFYGVEGSSVVRVTRAGERQLIAGRRDETGFINAAGDQARFARPGGLAVDAAGNIYVGDAPIERYALFAFVPTLEHGGAIRRIAPSGEVTTFCGQPGAVLDPRDVPAILDRADYFRSPSELAFDGQGRLFVLSGNVRRVDTAGAAPVVVLKEASAAHMAVSPQGAVHVARGGWQDSTIARVDGPEATTVVAGAPAPHRLGVTTGPLPGTLNAVVGLVAAGERALLAVSENSVLRIDLG